MAEAKLDKDEWIFNSMNRYSHLYMFDLEFPVDAFEVINDSSLCLAGLQTYSKNCELVQLAIPPKLLPGSMEDGLCKDRDFNIISGGYSPHRITQIKAVPSNPRLLATVQVGKSGIGLFELGDDDHAVTIPKGNLSLTPLASASLKQVITTRGNQIIVANNFGKIHEWRVDCPISSSTCLNHSIPEHYGGISKIKFWDENSVLFLTSGGTIALYDVRGQKIGLEVHSSKANFEMMEESKPANFADAKVEAQKNTGNTPAVVESKDSPAEPEESAPKGKTAAAAVEVSDEVQPESKQQPELLWSFDSVPPLHKVGIVDSCGGYETFDLRKVSSPLTTRMILPDCSATELLAQKFNIEYEPYLGFGSEIKFIVTGMKDENVHIYSDRIVGGVREVTPVFKHDGHGSTVTHCVWHPLTKNLLFSTAANSTLHAWQYINR